MDFALESINLTKFFGMVRAVDELNVHITEGELVGIVGPNGSGKTTFLNLITGYLKPERGQVRYKGKDITGLAPRTVVTMGIARSFQIPQLYLDLTVQENLLLALAIRSGEGVGFWSPLNKESRVKEALQILGQFGLEDYSHHKTLELPEGERKLLDIALSFAQGPQLLLMDEPTSGVSVKDKFAIMDTLVRILKGRVTSVFVEHDMDVIQRYADRMLVFNEGKVIADGTPTDLFTDPSVRKILLGKG
jgi:branched-chain amino acid transport system ATP-binding protein